jgi:hypothetical protein
MMIFILILRYISWPSTCQDIVKVLIYLKSVRGRQLVGSLLNAHTYIHIYIRFTDPVFVNKQLNMKEVNININISLSLSHTHTRARTHTHTYQTTKTHYTKLDNT